MQNQPQKILILGLVWPEPNSTGASVRMMEHIQLFLQQGWHITFASPAAKSEHMADLQQLGIHCQDIEINSASFDNMLHKLQPNIVIFDRFLMEEQFGWRVRSHCPDAVRVIETIDLHCLREARHQAYKAGTAFHSNDLHNQTALREIASIYRADLSIIISDYEMSCLQNHFQLSLDLLHLCPFMLKNAHSRTAAPTFEQRQHLMTIGNFRHAPNWDAVLWLKQEIWPLIRQQLPQAELHIYGAYTPPKATALHNSKEGFIIKNRADNVQTVMQSARLCLAPLRFGAGIKTKLADAMVAGTPSITTDIGSEGMTGARSWPGSIQNNAQRFATAAVALYQDKTAWLTAQDNGTNIVKQHFNYDINSRALLARILHIQQHLAAHRQQNFIGQMLNHHHHRSTEFMSRWIEAKNKNIATAISV